MQGTGSTPGSEIRVPGGPQAAPWGKRVPRSPVPRSLPLLLASLPPEPHTGELALGADGRTLFPWRFTYCVFFYSGPPFSSFPPILLLKRKQRRAVLGSFAGRFRERSPLAEAGALPPPVPRCGRRSSGPLGSRCSPVPRWAPRRPPRWRLEKGSRSHLVAVVPSRSRLALLRRWELKERRERGGTAFKYKSKPSVTGNPEKVARDINRGYNCSDNQGCSCKYSLSFLI